MAGELSEGVLEEVSERGWGVHAGWCLLASDRHNTGQVAEYVLALSALDPYVSTEGHLQRILQCNLPLVDQPCN